MAPNGATAITAQSTAVVGITVRNGSISSFDSGVALLGGGSIVEGLRVGGCIFGGISAGGTVKGNTVLGCAGGIGIGVGINATGIITGNLVEGSREAGILAGQGSTVIGNNVTGSGFGASGAGIVVNCPSNVTDNTSLNEIDNFMLRNLVLNGNGCNNTNNVAP